MPTKRTVIPVGTLRIKTKDLAVYSKTKTGWRKTSKKLPNTQQVIAYYKAHNKLNDLVDARNPSFLRGKLSAEGQAQGERITILPDNRKLGKAYSLFAKNLTMHDQSSHDHWDIMYQNPGGTWAYLYTEEKKAQAKKKKFAKVEDFSKHYKKLEKNILAGLNKRSDTFAVPLYTLLRTRMRVGSETYYKAHGHKGLTTLQKKDVTIKGRDVTFKFIGKDGVPQRITHTYPTKYITRLQETLKKKKKNDFIFANKNGHPLNDMHIKAAIKKYCGKEYYPHIIRSHYATHEAQQFLKTHHKPTKKEVREAFLAIADDLGHKKYNKKTGQWDDNYAVTIRHYIQPELVTAMMKSARQ